MSRSPFQGVVTVVRFNWHFYLFALMGVIVLLTVALICSGWISLLSWLAALGVLLTTVMSLVATYLAYDGSRLYRLDWLAPHLPEQGAGANIHAGFDETTALLRACYPGIVWGVYDFYDPKKHTEVSIQRARKAQPPEAGTIAHATDCFPADDDSLDVILLTLAAHEIRDHRERVDYFRDLRRSLKPGGLIVVTEHLRDLQNLIAYNLGAFHFHTAGVWLKTFREAGLTVTGTSRTAPLITTFVLTDHEDDS
ncbi:methyltransferase domain-containing protein [Oceaniferula spumae]